jgi:hypothetical protein
MKFWIQRKLAVMLYGIGTAGDYPEMDCTHGGHLWWNSRTKRCCALPKWLRTRPSNEKGQPQTPEASVADTKTL